MSNNNLNNVWRQLEEYRKQTNVKTNSNTNSESSISKYAPYQPEMIFAPIMQKNEPYYRPNMKEEEIKPATFVKFLWQVMNPTEMNVYPSQWIASVLEKYISIRKSRSLSFKDNKKHYAKDGFKGLSSPTIIACIVYHVFLDLKPTMAIPSVILIKYINEVIRIHYKNEKFVTLKQFDLYRTNAKKGIRPYLKKRFPHHFENEVIEPHQFVRVVARKYFRFSPEHTVETQKRSTRLKHSQKNTDELSQFSASEIALASIIVSAKIYNYKISQEDFTGMTKNQLTKLYLFALNNDPELESIFIKNKQNPF